MDYNTLNKNDKELLVLALRGREMEMYEPPVVYSPLIRPEGQGTQPNGRPDIQIPSRQDVVQTLRDAGRFALENPQAAKAIAGSVIRNPQIQQLAGTIIDEAARHQPGVNTRTLHTKQAIMQRPPGVTASFSTYEIPSGNVTQNPIDLAIKMLKKDGKTYDNPSPTAPEVAASAHNAPATARGASQNVGKGEGRQ